MAFTVLAGLQGLIKETEGATHEEPAKCKLYLRNMEALSSISTAVVAGRDGQIFSAS